MEVVNVISYLSVFLSLIYIGVLCTFILGWLRIPTFKSKHKVPQTTVSVLIAARNEEDKIAKTIQDLLAQSYPKHLTEIVIVDDHSTDETSAIISTYEAQGIRLIQLNEDKPLNSYKKKAIQTAINHTIGQLIISTDADCRMGPDWLSTIVEFYETYHYKMISAPVAYFEEKTFFERIQTLEFSYLIGLGASTIGNQKSSTCNGANLAYEREAFFEVDGFKGIDDLASGDDELLLHKIAERYERKIGFLKNRAAIVYTHAKPTLKDFMEQRKRWASKTVKYKNKVIIMIGVSIWLFNLSIIVNALLAIVFPHGSSLAFLLFQLASKIGIELIFLNYLTGFFKRKQLLVLLPLLNVMHIVYFVYIGIAGNSGKYNWKGRMVK